jgi:Calcineurin-like phosphoesterase
MIKQVVDRGEMGRYVEALRDQLDAPVTEKLASSGADSADVAPFMSRDPMQSLLQSTLEDKLRERGVPGEAPKRRDFGAWLVHLIESILHPVRFGPDDPNWVIDVAAAVLERMAKGNHPFNPLPAEYEISDNARVVIVGDWGTGLPRAQEVAKFMAQEVSEALAEGRETHVIHLGDIYYSGLKGEVRRHVLAPGMWPVSDEQATAGVTSWSLNGNHDMYSGGFGYFETLLADERFAKQRSSDGKATSFFRLRSPSWDFVALDTSWDTDVLSPGFVGVLQDPQAEFAKRVADESARKLMLLSHHQLLSVYDKEDLGPTLEEKLAPVLDGGRVTAWLWGHEHRCMGFEEAKQIKYPRCIGHGGVPVLMEHKPGELIPAPGAWEEREFSEYRGEHWGRMGFAVLDLAGPEIKMRYRNELGLTPREEMIG